MQCVKLFGQSRGQEMHELVEEVTGESCPCFSGRSCPLMKSEPVPVPRRPDLHVVA